MRLFFESEDDNTCCICGCEIDGFGNNPYPYKEEGRCCRECNIKYVIPARLKAMNSCKVNEDYYPEDSSAEQYRDRLIDIVTELAEMGIDEEQIYALLEDVKNEVPGIIEYLEENDMIDDEY